MSRALWFAAGAGTALYGVVKAKRVQEALTPDGLRDRGRALALGARMVREEAAQARAEKEIELREKLGLPQLAGSHRAGPRALEAPQHPATTTYAQIERGNA